MALISTRRALLGGLRGLDAIPWLLRDEFWDTRAAGAMDGTPATPGPGTRVVTDTNGKLTIGAGVANFATGGVGVGNPGMWWDVQARAAGRLLIAYITPSGVVNAHAGIGWDANQAGALTDSLNFAAGGVLQFVANGAAAYTVGAFTAVPYTVAIVQRAAGMYVFIKGGTFTTWTLLTISAAGNAAAYPAIEALGATSVFTADFGRRTAALWNPPLLASDTFTRANGAMGTTETTGPEAQVVTARTWTAIGGDLQIVGNAAQGVAAQANPVLDPGFETGGTGGNFNGGAEIDDGASDTFTNHDISIYNALNLVEATATCHSGSVAVKMTASVGDASLIRSVGTVTPGALYWVGLWTRGDGVANGRWSIYDDTNNIMLAPTSATGITGVIYTRILRLVATPAGCVSLRISYYGLVPGVSYVDDVFSVPCHAQYFDVGAADTQILANITTPAAGTTPFGLILRRNGATMWLVKITPGTAGTDFELIRLDNGAPTVLATADRDWTAATSYQIQVSLSGQAINVYDNGTLSLTYATAAVGLTNTQFGYFDAAEGNASLADIQVMNKSGAYEALNVWAAV